MLLTLTNLHTTLPNLHAQLQTFAYSRYKINTTKTKALPINLSPSGESSQESLQESSLKHLGNCLTSFYTSLYSSNYPQLFAAIRRLLLDVTPCPFHFLDVWLRWQFYPVSCNYLNFADPDS